MGSKKNSIKKRIEKDGFVLEYLVFGHGEMPLIALHGHAKSGEDYLFLSDQLPHYKIYAINLFFHGNSVLPPTKDFSHPIEINEWRALMEEFFKKENLDHFSLLAYSLGGRWAFNLVSYFENRVGHIILMAPDGLNKNGWYHRTSGSKVLRFLFKKVVKRPHTFLIVLRAVRKMRLITDRLYQFLLFHLETREKREKAYRTWMMYRNLFPNHKKINRIFHQHSYQKHLILGKYDAIISLKHSKKFLKLNKDLIDVHVIESGHDFFKEDNKQKIAEIIKGVLEKS